MPFLLAPVGDLVAVEATDADDRATYIFRTDDVERLNAVLVLTTFRREVYSLADDELGRWATAVRVLEPVRWMRGALAARGWSTTTRGPTRSAPRSPPPDRLLTRAAS